MGAKGITTIFIRTHEDVTPDFLAMRIAQTTGCLRPGESVRAYGCDNEWVIGEQSALEQIEEDLGGPLFGERCPTCNTTGPDVYDRDFDSGMLEARCGDEWHDDKGQPRIS